MTGRSCAFVHSDSHTSHIYNSSEELSKRDIYPLIHQMAWQKLVSCCSMRGSGSGLRVRLSDIVCFDGGPALFPLLGWLECCGKFRA